MRIAGISWALVAMALVGPFGCSDSPTVAADAGMDAHDHDAHSHGCVGFNVMPDGMAMLSGLVDTMHAHDGGADGGEVDPAARCVSMSADLTSGVGSSADGMYTVEARSLRGTMSPEAPDNEGLSLTIRRMGTAVSGLDVHFYARMPQHNGRVTGGHGPANDFNVQGLAVTPGAAGTYVIDPIDFNMVGYWLFEARFTAEGAEHRLYFAMETVGGGA